MPPERQQPRRHLAVLWRSSSSRDAPSSRAAPPRMTTSALAPPQRHRSRSAFTSTPYPRLQKARASIRLGTSNTQLSSSSHACCAPASTSFPTLPTPASSSCQTKGCDPPRSLLLVPSSVSPSRRRPRPRPQMLGFTGHRKSGAPERTNDLYLEDIEWLRRAGPWFDRRGGADSTSGSSPRAASPQSSRIGAPRSGQVSS